ncbi:hypothetical protein [Mycolicibacterium sp. XJ1819]
MDTPEPEASKSPAIANGDNESTPAVPDRARISEDSADEGADETSAVDFDTSSTLPADPVAQPDQRCRASRLIVFAVMPAIAIALAAGAGTLKWMNWTAQQQLHSQSDSIEAAQSATISLLSYAPDTIEEQLHYAQSLLTGSFRDSYTSLTNDVVIPGAKQKQISTVATVPAAASISANDRRAVVLLFVNQQVTINGSPPTATQSTIKVTLDKIGDRWLVSAFDPV